VFIGMWIGAASVLGFAVGLFAFRIRARWCPRCGATLGCVECRDRFRLAQRAPGT
jgi:hypothetical protein